MKILPAFCFPTILLTNIQSLKAKYDELSLVFSSNSPDIACLTETWLSAEIASSLVSIQGYFLVRNDRKSRKGGGTALYIRDNMPFDVIDTTEHLTGEIEATFVDLPSIDLSILCCYLPPHLNSVSLESVRRGISDITDRHLSIHSNRKLIVLGDFNHFKAEWLQSDLSLYEMVHQPTRGKNVLDHILISNELKCVYDIDNVSIHPPIGKSDHVTITMKPTNTQRKIVVTSSHVIYDYRSSNIRNLLNNAKVIDWSRLVDPEDDVNHQWKTLHQQLTSLLAQSIPKRTVFLTSNDKRWMTPITKMMINNKWDAYRSKNWKRYNLLKVKVREEICKAKAIWAAKIKSSSPYGLWKTVSQLSGKATRNELTTLITEFGSPDKLAEAIATNMTQNDSCVYAKEETGTSDNWTMHLSDHEVAQQLRKLSPRKAMGSDKIPNKIYCLLAPAITSPLRIIFESSITQKRFPSDWKKAIVIPIPKTLPPRIDKLRTISLLPAPAKVLEKLLLKNLLPSLEPLFGPNQHAFRKSMSTTTALLQTTDILTRIYDDPTYTGFGVLSLDFSKAFDRLDHATLLQKLMKNDLHRGFAQWLSSYLSGRSYQVRIQGQLSNVHLSRTGVPQGSVLGPTLFSILTGDLRCAVEPNYLVQYADDANIIIPFKTRDASEFEFGIREQLRRVEDWCTKNSQELNVCKSKLMIKTRSSLDFKRLPLPQDNSMKILGITINANLTWNDHIALVCKRACQRLHILRVLKPHVSRKELHEVYIALIRSLFDYCSPVFVNLPAKLSKQIQRVEKRAHRLMHGEDTVGCACAFDGFVERRKVLSLKLFTDILKDTQHLLHERLPQPLPHSVRLSNYSCRTNKRLNSFFPHTTLIFNKMCTRSCCADLI